MQKKNTASNKWIISYQSVILALILYCKGATIRPADRLFREIGNALDIAHLHEYSKYCITRTYKSYEK